MENFVVYFRRTLIPGGDSYGMSQMQKYSCSQKRFCKGCSQTFVPNLRFSIHANHAAGKTPENKSICSASLPQRFISEPYWATVRGLGAISSQLGPCICRGICRTPTSWWTNRHSWTGWIVALSPKKRHKLWVWTAMDRNTGRLLDWELGNRDSQTLAKLLNRLQQYNVTIYYTDKWDAYADLIPADMLVQTKRETNLVERNNSCCDIGSDVSGAEHLSFLNLYTWLMLH